MELRIESVGYINHTHKSKAAPEKSIKTT